MVFIQCDFVYSLLYTTRYCYPVGVPSHGVQYLSFGYLG